MRIMVIFRDRLMLDHNIKIFSARFFHLMELKIRVSRDIIKVRTTYCPRFIFTPKTGKSSLKLVFRFCCALFTLFFFYFFLID